MKKNKKYIAECGTGFLDELRLLSEEMGIEKMTYIDLFGGVGGFRLGIEKATDCDCVWYNDIDKYCVSGYNRRFGEKYEGTDIREVDERDIPDHDLLCAGFPCQSFSIAGRRQGLDDARGTLFFEIARILEQKRPRCVLLENVWGLLSHDKGKTFQRILKILADIGYRVQWQVLNSKDFGVPQNRNRVFIIGHLGEGSGRQIFPIGESGETHDTKSRCKQLSGGEGIAYALDANFYKGVAQQSRTMVQVADGYNGSLIGDEAKTLRSNEGCCRTGNIIISDSGLHRKNQLRNETIPPLRANTGAGWDNLVVPDIAGTLTGGGHSGGHHSDMCIIPEISNCLDADGYLRFGTWPRDENGKPQLLPITYRRIRRLTPVECERLQGFPDGWTAEGFDKNGEVVKISDTQRYRQLGNAVTVPVVEAIAKAVVEAISALMDYTLKLKNGGSV